MKKSLKYTIIFSAVFSAIYILLNINFLLPIGLKIKPEILFFIKTVCAFAFAVVTAALCGKILSKRKEE